MSQVLVQLAIYEKWVHKAELGLCDILQHNFSSKIKSSILQIEVHNCSTLIFCSTKRNVGEHSISSSKMSAYIWRCWKFGPCSGTAEFSHFSSYTRITSSSKCNAESWLSECNGHTWNVWQKNLTVEKWQNKEVLRQEAYPAIWPLLTPITQPSLGLSVPTK